MGWLNDVNQYMRLNQAVQWANKGFSNSRNDPVPNKDHIRNGKVTKDKDGISDNKVIMDSKYKKDNNLGKHNNRATNINDLNNGDITEDNDLLEDMNFREDNSAKAKDEVTKDGNGRTDKGLVKKEDKAITMA